jgi:hypothetical protein
MDEKLMAAINAAIQAYISEEEERGLVSSGQKLNPWKMAARRETMGRRKLAERGDPLRYRLGRFVIF